MEGSNIVAGTGTEVHTPPQVSARTEGRFIDGSFGNSAGKRDYKLYIPSGYIGQPVPLIVMLHGCVQTVEDLATGTRMNIYADEHTFLVAYPRQTLGPQRLNCWSWYNPGDQQRGRGEPAIIAGITKEMVSEYAVDPDRVYVTGISAGGAMSVVLGATYPDLFAAVGVHSGVEYAAAHSFMSAMKATRMGGPDPRRKLHWPQATPGLPQRFVPLILFHGDKDRLANAMNADQIITQWALAHSAAGNGRGTAGAPVQPASVIKDQVPGGRTFTRTIYQDRAGNEVMEKWIIHEAGHAWAGGDSQVLFMDPLGPNATAEMVRFFLAHPRQ